MHSHEVLILSQSSFVKEWLSHRLKNLDFKLVEDHEHFDGLTIIDVNMHANLKEVKRMEKDEQPYLIFSFQPPKKLLGVLFNYEITGFLHPDLSEDVFKEMIQQAALGNEFFDERVLSIILSKKYREINERLRSISEREWDIIDCILLDLTNEEIANKHGLSIRTVNAHKRNILKKLQTRSFVGATKLFATYTLRFD